MNILVVSQQYWPENWRIVDICEELVRRGHHVTVLCGIPNYETGHILPEYRDSKNRSQKHNGVTIIRCSEHPRRRNAFDRLLNYWSFSRSGKKAVRSFDGRFDVVFLNGLSPIMQSYPGLLYAALFQKKCLMYCLDLWPASLAAGGIKNHGFTKPLFQKYLSISSSIYRRCDRILVSSSGFSAYLSAFCGVDESKIGYLPQYSEEIFEKVAQPLIFHPNHINFVFAGNVGKAQDILTLLRAAQMVHDKRVQIEIVGDGSALKESKRAARFLSLTNVDFVGRLPLANMPSIYSGADAMLVTLIDEDFARLVVPGKVQTYMAAGKPIIACCGSSVNNIIREANCGYFCDSGDFVSLAELIDKMASLSNQERLILGNNAKNYSLTNFGRNSFFTRLDDELKNLAD